MIYVTGDIHGDIDISKLKDESFMKKVKEGDYLIICGDFGLIWDYEGENEEEAYWLDFLDTQPYITLFVDGNHENFERLMNDYPEALWHGGKVHRIRDTIYHLMRGQIFSIDDKLFFTMGGATSVDKFIRLEGKSWWKEELPSEAEYKEALINLILADNKVDYVITHCLPTSIQEKIPNLKERDHLTDFFEHICHILKFRKWFCGHYHRDQLIDRKYQILYQEILTLDDEIIVEDIE